jgi:hypothetical protein
VSCGCVAISGLFVGDEITVKGIQQFDLPFALYLRRQIKNQSMQFMR